MSADPTPASIPAIDPFKRETNVRVYPSDDDSRVVVQVTGETGLLTPSNAEKMGAALFEFATRVRKAGQ